MRMLCHVVLSFFLEHRPRSSTKLRHMLGSEPDLKGTSKMWGSLSLNCDGPKTAYFRVVLRQHISANIFRLKRSIDKRETHKLRRIPTFSANFSELW